jgi:hypothetical protein
MADGPYEIASLFAPVDPYRREREEAARRIQYAQALAAQADQPTRTFEGPMGPAYTPLWGEILKRAIPTVGGAYLESKAREKEADISEREEAVREEVQDAVTRRISREPFSIRTLAAHGITQQDMDTYEGSAYPVAPSPDNMSISESLVYELPSLSEDAQAMAAPFIQNMQLQEMMSEQDRQRAREDILYREGVEALYREPPERYRQLTPEELPPGARSGQISLLTGKTDYNYAPASSSGGGPIRYQQTDPVRLPDGSVVQARFNPGSGQYEYQNEDGQYVAIPSDSRPTTAGAGGTLNPKQFLDLRMEYLMEEQALNRMNEYLNTIGDINIGFKNLADQVSGSIKTLFDTGEYTPEEISRQVAQGQLQGLLGLFRTEIVGPGVMTEYDAQRVINALGGNIGALTNPQVVEPLLRQLYQDKQLRSNLLRQEVERNAPTYGYEVPAPLAPDDLVGALPQPSENQSVQNQADEIIKRNR